MVVAIGSYERSERTEEGEAEKAWKGTRDIRLMHCITQGVLGDLPSSRNW
jgi:hypothetical protein